MEDALKTFASKPEHKKADSAVVAILSHGVEGAVCGTDSTSTCREKKISFILCEAKISDTLGNNNNDFPIAETQNLVSIKDMEEIFNGAN